MEKNKKWYQNKWIFGVLVVIILAIVISIFSSTNSTSPSNTNTYTNVNGNQVHFPAYSQNGQVPEGATAQCSDGTYSFSQHRSGTCSNHGGVANWLY